VSDTLTSQGTLWVRSFGNPPARVVALHGFTLHGGMFAELAEELGVGVVAPDLPGHGRTQVEPITTAAATTAIAEMLTTMDRPLLLGYSQGARVALQFALNHPDLISGLVIVSGSPGLPERARKLRRVADEGLAARIETIGVTRFIDEWLANPMTATDAVSPERRSADRQIRLENTAPGLAAALRGMGQASVPDSSDLVGSLRIPAAFVGGRRDSKYSELAKAMAAARGARPVLVRGVGHNVILEAPSAVAATVLELLSE
jgi:2-succinyl-6-hydroxy-2,4-cyclohexadiene-1-carboxylate synthase